MIAYPTGTTSLRNHLRVTARSGLWSVVARRKRRSVSRSVGAREQFFAADLLSLEFNRSRRVRLALLQKLDRGATECRSETDEHNNGDDIRNQCHDRHDDASESEAVLLPNFSRLGQTDDAHDETRDGSEEHHNKADDAQYQADYSQSFAWVDRGGSSVLLAVGAGTVSGVRHSDSESQARMPGLVSCPQGTRRTFS
jgi:hypothetical protein